MSSVRPPYNVVAMHNVADTINGLLDLADELSQDSKVQGSIILIARRGKPLGMRTTGQFSISDDQTILALLKSLHVCLHTSK